MKPIVIAIDPATTCGCAVGPIGGKPRLTSHRLGAECHPNIDVFGRAARLVADLVDQHHPVLVAVEEPFFKNGESNYGATKKLHGLYGAVTGIVRARNVMVWSVAVSTWRATALGTSKFGSRDGAKKAMMALCMQLGWPAVDDNAADAAGIFIWATAKYAPYGAIPSDISAVLT